MQECTRELCNIDIEAAKALTMVPNLLAKQLGQVSEPPNASEVIQALVQRKLWLRAVLDNTGVGTALIDISSFAIIEACGRLCKMLGYVPEDLVTRRYIDLIAPTHQRLHIEGLLSIRSDDWGNTGGAFKQELQCLRQDGTCIWTQFTVLSCTPGLSSRYGTLVVTDIEEKKSAQLLIEQKALKLQQMVDSLSVAAVHISRRDGAPEDPLVYLNPHVQKLLGYTMEEVPTLYALFRELYREDSLRALNEYEQVRHKFVRAPTTVQVFCKDGRKKLLDISWSIHAHGEVWILHDATDCQSATEKFQKMFELSRDPYLIISTDRILECNEAAVKILGMESKADTLRLRLEDINPPLQADGRRSETVVGENWAEVLVKGQLTFEWTHKKKDGTTFLVDVHVTTCTLEGQTVLMTVWHDLAAQKESESALKVAKEAAEESSRVKSRFLSNCSHEIRTPMNGVIGITDILLQTSLTSMQRQYVEILRGSGETLMTLINDILDLSKIESDTVQLESIPFRLNDLVDSAKALLEPVALTKGIALTTSFGTMVPIDVVGDPMRLRQVIMNLVGNSIKFTSRGSVRINVSVPEPAQTRPVRGGALEQHPSQMLEGQNLMQNIPSVASNGCSAYPAVTVAFEVRDTGIGIPVEAQGKLFNAFVQADSSTSRRYGGSGLGLCICKSLVTLMRGDIRLTSEAGIGTSFIFSIPLELDCSHQHVPLSSTTRERLSVDEGRMQTAMASLSSTSQTVSLDTPPLATSQPHLHVLVAEDNRVNQIVATQLLHSLGHSYDLVEDGRRAVQLACERSYDFILMDCHMPEMDGYEAARFIREMEQLGRLRVPIIALTAAVMDDDVVKCTQAGMDFVLSKPVRKVELAKAILSVIERRGKC